jgi:hypothetical protein
MEVGERFGIFAADRLTQPRKFFWMRVLSGLLLPASAPTERNIVIDGGFEQRAVAPSCKPEYPRVSAPGWLLEVRVRPLCPL